MAFKKVYLLQVNTYSMGLLKMRGRSIVILIKYATIKYANRL